MTTAQTTNATETQQAAPAVTPTSAPSKGFDWAGTGKTIGIFVGGAAVGAAGKWAWDHFFG